MVLDDQAEAAVLLDKAIAGCKQDEVDEVVRWETPSLAGERRS